eukprot:gnl/TRDRNA2_/TRDRNA2_194307_c0_seq1.p1 gnl/TRDRNA2_/TRDRNA2_194307_c0~~gnl/TRDRNA2_/TRDRNA2_194307_c0_seq1.p1  ORF type:complete len:264 (-),score=30.32 gnl/TRDRNA2_/TRDRNA2_194307_c0_seq1:1-792(-)
MRPYLARPWVRVFQPTDRSAPPWWSPAQRTVAGNIFRSAISAHPPLVIQTLHRLPDLKIPQICMIGHSNVGKSTLINGLVYGKEIARPSTEPGRTRHLFIFDLGRQLSLVDLPGYGYAKVQAKLRMDWEELVQTYMQDSPRLCRAVCLVNAVRGYSKEDLHFWEQAQAAGRKVMVVLTKVDLCHAEDLHRNVSDVLNALHSLDQKYVWPYLHAVSAEQDMGMRELRASLAAESRAAAAAEVPAPGRARLRRGAASGAPPGERI